MSEFWLINISKVNVSLSDLGITIPAGKSWNLLDSKHFHFKLEQLERSRKDGSIYKKRDKVVTGKQCPGYIEDRNLANKLELSKQPIQRKTRSVVKIEDYKYDDSDWAYSDEQFAEEMSEDYE